MKDVSLWQTMHPSSRFGNFAFDRNPYPAGVEEPRAIPPDQFTRVVPISSAMRDPGKSERQAEYEPERCRSTTPVFPDLSRKSSHLIQRPRTAHHRLDGRKDQTRNSAPCPVPVASAASRRDVLAGSRSAAAVVCGATGTTRDRQRARRTYRDRGIAEIVACFAASGS